MTTVQQVYEVMRRLAPPELAEHWDNPGLLVDCGGAVRRVLVTLDITPEVVEEAAAKQCTVIVAHHPVIFDPLKRLCPADVPYQLVPDTGAAVQVKFADAGKPVHRLAVISGAGGSLFAEAIAEGADCLLTGEANHHHALDAKRLGLSLIAAGHYATEFPVTAAVAAALRTALPELEVLVSTENRDPYTYL